MSSQESASAGQPSDESAGRVPELEPLDVAVARAVAEVRALRRRAREAEERAERSDQLLREFGDGTQDPAALASKVTELQRENEALRDRVRRGREGIDQIMARIRFLEGRQ